MISGYEMSSKSWVRVDHKSFKHSSFTTWHAVATRKLLFWPLKSLQYLHWVLWPWLQCAALHLTVWMLCCIIFFFYAQNQHDCLKNITREQMCSVTRDPSEQEGWAHLVSGHYSGLLASDVAGQGDVWKFSISPLLLPAAATLQNLALYFTFFLGF